ncbi:MAG: DNA polymerase III subunit beta [Burkholderiales bacterium]|nr:DNA polymerase III subunit beta [Burkholderiales bacterium]
MSEPFIKTSNKDLLDPVQITAGVIEKKQPLPILANILIRKDGVNVTFLGSDNQIFVKAKTVIGSGEGQFATTLSAKKLTDILKTFDPSDEVSLSQDKSRIKLVCGKSKFELQPLPAENYPEIVEDETFNLAFSMPCSRFKDMLNKVQFATDVNGQRYFLNGILLDVQENNVVAVATDGHRMSYFKVDLEEPCKNPTQAIILKKTSKELLRLVPDSDEILHVHLSDNKIKVTFKLIEVISNLIEGKYPDYKRVIPPNNSKVFTVTHKDLKKSLKKVKILTTDQVKNVCWNLKPGSLSFKVTNTDMEEAEDEISIDYNGEALEIYFNVDFFLEMLEAIEADSFKIALETSMSSSLVQITDNDNYKYVVMPVRM